MFEGFLGLMQSTVPNATSRTVRWILPRATPSPALRKTRFATYDPDRDIFSNDFSEENEADVKQQTAEKRAAPLSINEADLVELIDTGDLIPKQELIEEHPDLEVLSMKRLRSICRSYGLKLTGLKRDLIERIVDYEKTHKEGSCWRSGSPPPLEELLAM